jgi:hypothetical protein
MNQTREMAFDGLSDVVCACGAMLGAVAGALCAGRLFAGDYVCAAAVLGAALGCPLLALLSAATASVAAAFTRQSARTPRVGQLELTQQDGSRTASLSRR